MNIVFSKSDHKYTDGDDVYMSVSKVISKFKNEFRRDHWATYKALQVLLPDFNDIKKGWNIESDEFIIYASGLVDQNLLIEEIDIIKKSWDENNAKSIEKGNFYHEQRENDSYKKGFEINPMNGLQYKICVDKQEGDKSTLVTNLYDLNDGYYPELLIWNKEYKIAGQSDQVFIDTNDDIRVIHISDFKTNSKISMHGFKGQKMKGPLKHLPDSNYYHYNLQISTYAWMLEQFGFKVGDLSFYHFNKPYMLKYLKNEVELMLENI